MGCFSLRTGAAEIEMACFSLGSKGPAGMVLSVETEILKLIEIETGFGTELYSEADLVLCPSDSGQLESSRKY